MSIFQSIKETTNRSLQFLKEKTGISHTEINPDYQDAVEKFLLLQQRIQSFSEELEEIIRLIPQVIETANALSGSLVTTDRKFGGPNKTIVNTIDLFMSTIKEDCNGNLTERANNKVIPIIRDLESKMKRLDELKTKRRDTQLLADSLRDDIASLSQKGDPQKLAKKKILHEVKTVELNDITANFIMDVKELWNNRYDILEKPLQEFIGLAFEFCRNTFCALQITKNVVSEEDLTKEYLPC